MQSSSVKILHTSDWHLGQYFMGKSRQVEHQQFLSWLIDLAVAEKVSVIIVAGDVFDTGAPPSYARQLYNQFVVDLQSTGISLIVLGGNHDSVATLGESKALLAQLNTYVIPGASQDPQEQVITLNNGDGEPAAIVCAIPFLRPRDIVESVAGQSGTQKQQSLQQAISDHYQSIYQLACQRREHLIQQGAAALPIIATGHLTTVGAKSSESVRDIYIGSLDAFPSSAFPPADYIALGHIHRTQKVGGSDHIRYCGSPIALSFDELGHDKTVLVAEFIGGCLDQVTSRPIPRFQPMHLIKGDLDQIESEIVQLAQCYDQSQPAWLDIEVSVQDYLNDLPQRIGAMTEGLPLEVLLLRKARKQRLHSIDGEYKETLQELSPKDVFERRLALEQWNTPEQKAQKTRITQAFDEVLSQALHDSTHEFPGIDQ